MAVAKWSPEYYDTDALNREEGERIESLRKASAEIIPDPDGWLAADLERNVILTSADIVLNWARRSSLWPLMAFPACCAMEFMSMSASRFDISRFGMEVIRPSPRQADLMITAGTMTWKMATQMKRLYDQMAEPKWVIAMGACAISGGTFANSYCVVPGYNRIVPVDVYVPGCPPRPEALLHAIQMLQHKVSKERNILRR